MIMGRNAVLIITFVFAIAFPVGMMIWWKRRTGESIWSFAAGALCFVLFAMVLENLMHQVCLGSRNAVSSKILASPVLYTLYAAFAAGIFEETGRLFGFKVLLRNNNKNSCAVAYGIGHGGMEVILILGVSYLTMLLAAGGVKIGTAEATAQILANAQSITFATAGIAMFERISAMMIHIGLSMLVYTAARNRKQIWLYPVAILLHALVDAPAAMYQYRAITSLAVVEGCSFVIAVICLVLGRIVLYRNNTR